MATIIEDYISFETAKLLKEKGFDDSYCRFVIESDKTYYRGAPTLQMAMKWLREVHNLSIEPYYDFVLNWVVDIKHIGKFTDIKEFEYIREKTYKSYEDACEAAIKYCLEHLI